ncbi:MAG: large subunit ribosomal protein L17, partial [Saprospiraceae bacterium]
MRHGKKFNHLGRQKGHREAMLSNMATSLIIHKRINTTVAKAKALRKYVEPIITRSKVDSTHSRRVAFSYLQSKDAIKELFSSVASKIGERPGGYTRILRTGFRSGDSAEMCMIELVDFNDSMLDANSSKKKSRRRTKKKTSDTAPVAEKVEAAIEDAEVVEVAEE